MRLHEAAPKLIIQERTGDRVKVLSYWPVPELTRAELALGRLHLMTTTPYAPIEPSAKERMSMIQANTTPLELKAQAFDFQTHTTTSSTRLSPPTMPPPAQKSPPHPKKKRKTPTL